MYFIKSYLLAFIVLLCVSFNTHAGIDREIEKTAVTQWVLERTKGKINPTRARYIVNAVYKSSDQHNVDPLIILGMISKESMFQRNAQSFYGAKGLMQVVPRYHGKALAGRDVFNIDANIDVGTQYIKHCIKNRKTLRGAMNCYSGGAKGYFEYVEKRHREIKQAIILTKFENRLALNVNYEFTKPLTSS